MFGLIQHATVSAILVCVFCLGGCAFGTRSPTLTYPPENETSGTSVAHAAVKPTAKNVHIVLKPFADQRSDKKVVGTVRNGLGMRTADVIPTNNVADWVTQAVRTELQDNGYSVTSEALDDNSESPSAVLSGEVLNVFCDMYFNYTGQVSIIVRVNKDETELINRHYAGEGSTGIVWAGTEESYAESLELALSSALNQFITDLDMILYSNK